MKLVYGIYALFLLAVASSTVVAQSSDTIVPNPQAAQLRKVWEITGRPLKYDEVGYGAARLPDLTGDSINEFAVYKNSTHQWLLYAGGRSTLDVQPIRIFDSMTASTSSIAVGNFFGSGSKCVAFSRYVDSLWSDSLHRDYYQLLIYQVDPDLAEVPAVIVDPRSVDSSLLMYVRDVQFRDLDNDSSDELILQVDVWQRQGVVSSVGEYWIYKGGKEVDVLNPSVIIRDTQENDYGTLNVSFVHLDGDQKLDMVIGARQAGGARLKFYFSDDNSPYSWANRPPDREILLLPNNGIAITTPPFFINLDGDSIADVVGKVFTGDNIGIYFYLSRSAKPMTSRSYSYDDADIVFHTVYGRNPAMGSLNDSLQRYDMLPLSGIGPHRGAALLALSGGRNGPNRSYDAWYPDDGDESFFARAKALFDVTGDGWRDYLGANERWGAFVDQGIAMVLAGGPYIPTDDPTTDVQEVPIAQRSGGLFLWPNPVRERLNIAWRGDLRPMPERFELYDTQGRYCAGGNVDPAIGSAMWERGETASGTYFLRVMDGAAKVIAVAQVCVE